MRVAVSVSVTQNDPYDDARGILFMMHFNWWKKAPRHVQHAGQDQDQDADDQARQWIQAGGDVHGGLSENAQIGFGTSIAQLRTTFTAAPSAAE